MQKKGDKLTTGQVAKLLGLTRMGIHARITNGTLRAEQVAGHLWVIDRSEVDRQLEKYGHGKMNKKHAEG